MGVDGHALYCMANRTDQFGGDLKLVEGDHQVDRIGSGIAIKGIGTFKFRLEDNTDRCIPSGCQTCCMFHPSRECSWLPTIGHKRRRINH